MTPGVHPDLGPELRRLAQTILDGIDPAVRLAVARASGVGVGTGKCQQAWCPVCALAALVTGDQHPLLTAVAEHSVALLDVIRAIVNDIDRSPTPPPGGPSSDGEVGDVTETDAVDGTVKSRYQPIPVTVED